MKRATIRIQRGAPGEAARMETFETPYREGMSVLDALIWIRNNADPTLAFRYSCINANACKECMVRVDDRVDYACTARLGRDGATVRPLANKTLIRDLATDIAPPRERLATVLRRD